jgi:hypothetical protein
MFCQTVWIFSGILITLMLLYDLGDGGVMGCDLLATILGLLLPFGCVLSVLWLAITLVWCAVIAKKENNKMIFLKPVVVVTTLINIVNFIWISSFIAF